MDRLEKLYCSVFGQMPKAVMPLPGAGSNRRYFRLTGVESVIGTIGVSCQENNAFIYFSELFASRQLPVPKVLAVSDDRLCYLQEDLGDTSLCSEIAKFGAQSDLVNSAFERLIELLPKFQYGYSAELDASKCYPRRAMDTRAVMWDLNYFKYSFIKATGIDFDEDQLEDEFEILAAEIVKNPNSTLLLRDFQSRNVMVKNDDLYVIDFQGTRMGEGLYDVASLLWQARAGLTDEQRIRYAQLYQKAVEATIGKPIENFSQRLTLVVLFRLLQVLGAYGFRGLFERKAIFLEVIPLAVASLGKIVKQLQSLMPGFLPYLSELLLKVAAMPRFAAELSSSGLIVTVMSFSYKKGIPEDLTGNGGGFVFDCRAMHNPGRYNEYKQLTGRDKPVIDFLEERGEMAKFLENCYSLVDASVERYIQRGFANLAVNFGCTGGQHRSVYGAEHLARHISEKYGVAVKLIHREQSITEYFPAK